MVRNNARSVLFCAVMLALGVSAPVGTAHADADAQLRGISVEQAGEITGVVRDAQGGFLRGAEVRVQGMDVVAVTDSEGRFLLRRIPEGAHTIELSYVGRPTRRESVTVVAGALTTANVVVGETGLESDLATLDGIQVRASRPQAESEAMALQIQRSSNALVNVVAADSIGHFPDQNIAAALGRLPGVAVERDQGQERSISLRGAPSRWSTISFDGVNVIAPGGKSARTDTIPSGLANSVIVRKAVTADMSGETLAGNVDIITRGAFDYDGLQTSLNTGIGYNDLGGGRQYDVSGFISNTFADGLFGVALTASAYEREMITDNFETDWEMASEDREPGNDSRAWADAHQNKLYRLTRGNTALASRFDFRPSQDHRFFLSTVHTEFTDDELRNAMEFDFDDSAQRTNQAAVTRGYADVRSGNTPLEGNIYGVELDSSLNANSTAQSIFTNTLGGDQRLGEWDASWRLNYTQSKSEHGPSFNSSWRSPRPGGLVDYSQRPTVEYDFTDRERHGVRLYDTIVNPDGSFSRGNYKRSLDPQDYEFVYLRSTSRLQDSRSRSGRLDLTRALDLFGQASDIQFGVQYDKRSKEDTRHVLEILPGTLTAAGVQLPSPSDFSIDRPYKGKLPLGYAFRYFSEAEARKLWSGLHGQGLSNVRAGDAETNNYRVTEEVLAAYAMATTWFDWGNIVAGVRVESVDNTGEALVQYDSGFEPVRVSGSDTVVLPSVHLNWDINDELKLRLSANTGAARPDFTLLRPNFSVDDEEQVVSGGNPDLGAEKAAGLDAYLEWYLPSGAFFSVGAYYKWLDDVLFDMEFSRFGSDVLDRPGLDRSEYIYETTANGSKGHLAGIEVAFSQTLEPFVERWGLPEWAAGFGIRGNMTFNDSETETPDGRKVALPGSSDFIYNLALSYERYGLSTRLSWQHRSEWIDGIGDGDYLGDTYWDKVGRLDFKTSYRFNPNTEVFLEANNLLKEPGIRYDGARHRVSEYEAFGARYMVGLRLNF
ncbi:TonB-dependent receptor [Luteimonas qiangzhengi]|uniref:TonB-dependent receptor n=1 Tax=Luteimonas sp. MJ146 TaxID=3129240 RepID=UPI0031BA61A3